jgi:hypothetical protein
MRFGMIGVGWFNTHQRPLVGGEPDWDGKDFHADDQGEAVAVHGGASWCSLPVRSSLEGRQRDAPARGGAAWTGSRVAWW